MTSDDQHFLDVLSGISNEVKKFTSDFANATDRHFDSVATSIREALASSSWLPESARPSPPPPPPASLTRIPAGYLTLMQRWVSRNRALTAAIVAFMGTGAFLVYRQRKLYRRKRRAGRTPNGARKEVIVIAGPPTSPITKSLALDLERRGFIVYMVVNTVEEEQMIQNEMRPDIRPFHLDIGDPLSTQKAIERFSSLLLSPHHAFAGAIPHELSFIGLILAPDLIYSSGPIETLSPELWSDALNAKVLGTVATTQAFLPTVCEFKARILMLTPSIVSSLQPAFHGLESAVVGALEGFTTTLSRELSTVGIDVCHIKLGTFDCSSVGAKTHLQPIVASKTYLWPASARALYSQNFINQDRVALDKGLFSDNGSTAKGTSLRELHNSVFDALKQKRPQGTWRVGRGSFAYGILGNWVPAGLVGWFLGIRRVSLEEISEPSLDESAQSWEKVERVP